ncbi:MAG TPA: hypothetical protein VGN72_08225 [Tepidisphaeraceae bacterium]|jgi:type II secretory pathway component PulJ|nr:hypothetical protein [Tepidisphaeraceae bacterium]
MICCSTSTRPISTSSVAGQLNGFMLIEMLITLVLFSTFALVAGRLFHTTFRTTHRVEVAHTAMSQWADASLQLRQDVWGARDITVANPQRCEIRLSGADTAIWEATESGELQRTLKRNGEPTSPRRWNDLQRTTTFERDDAGLAVLSQVTGAPPARLSLARAIPLMQEGQP